MSVTIHTSVPRKQYDPSMGSRSRVSIVVLGVGAQIIESLEAAFRAGSITVSEARSENAPMPDEDKPSQGSHLQPGRPQSLPTRLHPPLRLQQVSSSANIPINAAPELSMDNECSLCHEEYSDEHLSVALKNCRQVYGQKCLKM
ncbi:hypothetical protein BDU57DRAFT_531205 [Ampelomyces quisqualis]|uniref:Uncharacterized protein n=1 Tax=Ampelomyces quisqualis TaxID=50730 RepID=A0A6A5QJX2_AMPQU|nr:hypothetical protein BDU57DRAFT_531205 [Ampelomyces quisqualis]